MGLRITVDGALISEPYVELTLSMMKRFGVDVAREADDYFVVPRGVIPLAGPFCCRGGCVERFVLSCAGRDRWRAGAR